MEKKLVASAKYPHQFYYVVGNGDKTILLIHGFSEDPRIFAELVTHFSKEYTIILPNLPGSASTVCIADMSIESLADYCHTILQENKCAKIVIAGHSMGGYIALAFAKKYPDNILGICNINSNVFADSAESKGLRNRRIKIVQDGGKGAYFANMVKSLYAEEIVNLHPEKIENHLAQSKELSADAVVAYHTAMRDRLDFAAWVSNCNKPFQFIIGKNDTTLAFEKLMEQTIIPNITFIWISKTGGHMSMVEHSKELAYHLQFFATYCASQ